MDRCVWVELIGVFGWNGSVFGWNGSVCLGGMGHVVEHNGSL